MAFQLTLVLLSVVVISFANVSLGKRVARDGTVGDAQPANPENELYKSAFKAITNALNCTPTVHSATQQVMKGSEFVFTVVIPSDCSANAGKTCVFKVFIGLAAQPEVQSNSCSA